MGNVSFNEYGARIMARELADYLEETVLKVEFEEAISRSRAWTSKALETGSE